MPHPQPREDMSWPMCIFLFLLQPMKDDEHVHAFLKVMKGCQAVHAGQPDIPKNQSGSPGIGCGPGIFLCFAAAFA